MVGNFGKMIKWELIAFSVVRYSTSELQSANFDKQEYSILKSNGSVDKVFSFSFITI